MFCFRDIFKNNNKLDDYQFKQPIPVNRALFKRNKIINQCFQTY